MNGPIHKSLPTLADYKAAEARLADVRTVAVAGFEAAQERGDVGAGDEWATRLKHEFDKFKAFREGLPRDVLLSIHADRILETFSVDKDNFINLVIPADVSDEDAMHALTGRFRDMFPDKYRAAICESYIDPILDSGGEGGRRARGPRVIKLIGVVPGTASMTRDEQKKVLKQKGLTFSHPIEQSLAAAAYACRCNGEDLFNYLTVRGSSSPRFLLGTNQDYGVFCLWYSDPRSDILASGCPLSLRRQGTSRKNNNVYARSGVSRSQ